MRGTVAKRLRRLVYGDNAAFENVKMVEERSHMTASGRPVKQLFTFWRREPKMDLRQAYRRAKREWSNDGHRPVSA